VETGIEGWQPDPFGRHEQRWHSDGQPTWLVRDGKTEDEDPLPGMSVPHRTNPAPNSSSAPAPGAPNWAYPAKGVTLTVVNAPEGAGTSPLTRKKIGFLFVRSLVSLFVLALVALLVLDDTLVLVGIVLLVAIFWGSMQFQKSRIRQNYGATLDDWMSRVGFFEGPFDGAGLPEATSFKRKYGVYTLWGNTFPVRILMNSDGIVFGSAGAAGISMPVTVPFSELRSVELVRGTRQRTLVVTPGTAQQVGQVLITTVHGRVARFSGVRIKGLQAALDHRGAVVVGPTSRA
jgi:hypothetical protein